MKILKSILIFCTSFFILFFNSCYVKRASLPQSDLTVTPLGDRITIHDGSLVYALPMTVFNIDIEFEKIFEKPGPYARFAGDLLGLTDVITSPREWWRINSITVETSEEPDPSEYYVIESNTLVHTNALALKRIGLILDLNPDAMRTEKSLISSSENINQILSYKDLGSSEYYISHSDTAYRMVKLDTTFIRVPYLVERRKPLTPEQLAEQAARTLLEIREGKHMILTGEANVFPQSRDAIDEINRTERELTALFTGKTASEKKTIRYTCIPEKGDSSQSYILCRFSVNSGPSPADSDSGNSLTIEFLKQPKSKDLTYIPRPVTLKKQPSIVYDKLFYRPPEAVRVKLKYGNETLYEARKLVYQFGDIYQLPSNFILGK